MPATSLVRSVNAVDLLITTLEVMVGIGTIKLLAYRFHGNPFSQAVLVLF